MKSFVCKVVSTITTIRAYFKFHYVCGSDKNSHNAKHPLQRKRWQPQQQQQQQNQWHFPTVFVFVYCCFLSKFVGWMNSVVYFESETSGYGWYMLYRQPTSTFRSQLVCWACKVKFEYIYFFLWFQLQWKQNAIINIWLTYKSEWRIVLQVWMIYEKNISKFNWVFDFCNNIKKQFSGIELQIYWKFKQKKVDPELIWCVDLFGS